MLMNHPTIEEFVALHENGYSMDMYYILKLLEEKTDVTSLVENSKKLEVIFLSMKRKSLVDEGGGITQLGREVLHFTAFESKKVSVRRIIENDDFDRWWKAYPGTDTFVHKGKSFSGSRSMRVRKDDCKVKLNKILSEGEYTIDDLVKALEFDVLQKKENSLKTGTNKLTYMQNSLTYLNQRSFEPFIELIKQNSIIEEQTMGGTDI
jgi:hypothetical protein